MSSRKRNTISQADARRLRARVEELERILERQRRRFAQDYPGGTNVATLNYDSDRDLVPTTIRTARLLGHAVVAVDNGRSVLLYALPHPETPA